MVSGTIGTVFDAEGTRDPSTIDHVSLPVCVSVSLSVSDTDPEGAIKPDTSVVFVN